MPPARGGNSDFSVESIEELKYKPAVIFDDDDCGDSLYSDQTDLMDLDEFLTIHEGKSTEVGYDAPPNNPRTSDLLSDLLKTVHKNLGIPRGSHPSAFKLPKGSARTAIESTGEEHYKNANHSDHQYVIEKCKVEVLSEDEMLPLNCDQKLEPERQSKSKRRKPRTYRYNPKPVQQKSSRNFVPDSQKDLDYWEKRKRNNQAAKKSREDRRRKELEVLNKMANLEKQNAELSAQVKALEEKNRTLTKKLKEATKAD